MLVKEKIATKEKGVIKKVIPEIAEREITKTKYPVKFQKLAIKPKNSKTKKQKNLQCARFMVFCNAWR